MKEEITIVYFVRHAAVDLKAGEAVEENPSLNKKGLKQAHELAKQFHNSDFKTNYIFTSSMKRALETAKIIGNSLKINPLFFSEFNEISRSIFERKFWTNKFWRNYSKYKKACKKFDETIKKNKGKNLIFVIHGNLIRSLMGYKLGLSLNQVKHFSYNNANISRLTFKGKRLNTISYFNSKVLF